MKQVKSDELQSYFEGAESWAEDREAVTKRSQRIAWTIAAVAAGIALLEALALWALVPLKTEVPYTLLVDRQTGYVQAIDPLKKDTLTPDKALTRSFLVQYVIARESYDSDTLSDNYRKVGLWSAGDARQRYMRQMTASNPDGILATIPRSSNIDVKIRSVSSLSDNSAMVRFSTVQTNAGGQQQIAQHWASIIKFGYSQGDMSADDRLLNPLGFQVLRYRKDAETLPEVESSAVADNRQNANIPQGAAQ